MNLRKDICHCIYEFIECKKNLDCVNCEVAVNYWEEIKASVKQAIEQEDFVSERVSG